MADKKTVKVTLVRSRSAARPITVLRCWAWDSRRSVRLASWKTRPRSVA